MKANEYTQHLNGIIPVCIKTGGLVNVGLIFYFFIMRLFNLHEVLILRAGNFLFLVAGILYVLRYFTKKERKIPYFQGIKIGILVTFFSVLPFALFMLIFLNVDTVFMTYIQQHSAFGEYLNPVSSAGAVVFEGIVSGFLLLIL